MSNTDVLSDLKNILSLMKGMTPDTYESFEPRLLAEARELIQTDYCSDESFTIIVDPATGGEIVEMGEIALGGDHIDKKQSLKTWSTSADLILLSWAA
ncbi:MAG: hypothetical protein EOM68_04600 [Spirochaetia bacterium]|nr:hypothetical protein [Spirochaetia bacterium]